MEVKFIVKLTFNYKYSCSKLFYKINYFLIFPTLIARSCNIHYKLCEFAKGKFKQVKVIYARGNT
jgi:hypothetical protein